MARESDLGQLIEQIQWKEVPFLREIPRYVRLPNLIREGSLELLRLSQDNAVPVAKAFPALSQIKPNIMAEAQEAYQELSFRRFIFHFMNNPGFSEDPTLFYLALRAEKLGRDINIEYGRSFLTTKDGKWGMTEPVRGGLTCNPQRYLRDILDTSETRLSFDVHTHPDPAPPTVPEDLGELLTGSWTVQVSRFLEKQPPPIAAMMTLDEENFWIVMRSKKTPKLDEYEFDTQVLWRWDQREVDEDATVRILRFAKTFKLAVFRGSTSDLTIAERLTN